jgi:hypothetical protein
MAIQRHRKQARKPDSLPRAPALQSVQWIGFYGPTPLGMLAVLPEMLLLHKAFTVNRAKDDHEFKRIRDRPTADQWAWIKCQMELMLPKLAGCRPYRQETSSPRRNASSMG